MKKNPPESIENILVCDSIKYLRVIILNNRNGFTIFKKERLSKARQLANLNHCIIARRCNRI